MIKMLNSLDTDDFVLLPTPQYGDSMTYELGKIFINDSVNLPQRKRQNYWQGSQIYELISNIFKCHLTLDTFNDIVDFLIRNNGIPITIQHIIDSVIIQTQTGIIIINDCAENNNTYNLGLRLQTVI